MWGRIDSMAADEGTSAVFNPHEHEYRQRLS
jgi:hypothetical protein